MHPRTTLTAFDRYLAARGIGLTAVVVGGAALNLLGVVSRQTRDCDVIHPQMSAAVLHAARAFAAEVRTAGEALRDDWLNNGPASLAHILPVGWEDRLQEAFRGRALILRTLHRSDLLLSKLFALCDRAIDLSDCLAMAPTPTEIEASSGWLVAQDLNPHWPAHVQATLEDLGRRLGHAS